MAKEVIKSFENGYGEEITIFHENGKFDITHSDATKDKHYPIVIEEGRVSCPTLTLVEPEVKKVSHYISLYKESNSDV